MKVEFCVGCGEKDAKRLQQVAYGNKEITVCYTCRGSEQSGKEPTMMEKQWAAFRRQHGG
jgi:hypothetical protein